MSLNFLKCKSCNIIFVVLVLIFILKKLFDLVLLFILRVIINLVSFRVVILTICFKLELIWQFKLKDDRRLVQLKLYNKDSRQPFILLEDESVTRDVPVANWPSKWALKHHLS